MSNISKRRKEGLRTKIKSMADHTEFLKRISKTLYYGQLLTLPRLSVPATEISCELWSESQRGRSLRRLHTDAAASIARSACVSPCALVLAIIYLERLKACNPDYIANMAPADLFLVSLMVGNKFLQDNGEDDDVTCSEWAESGGLDTRQLKKLEVEFLDAIDWNVFVNDRSFEAGLLWLERQVALKQAQLRGFFTYCDLEVSCDSKLLIHLMMSVFIAGVGYATFLASAVILSHAWLLLLQYMATSGSITTLDTNIISHTLQPDLAQCKSNATLESSTNIHVEEEFIQESLKFCTKCNQYQDHMAPKQNWYDALVVYDWKSLEPWWSTTSVFNWLYQRSLVNPMQQWLQKINEYADLVSSELISETANIYRYSGHAGSGATERYVRQWLNLSKPSTLVVSVADR